jgi:GMP reductase
MRIEESIKLDYKDVLLRPKRSTLNSRSEVDIFREFGFKNHDRTIKTIPIIASNMDGIGTFSMAHTLAKHQLMTALHKHYDVDELEQFYLKNEDVLPYIFYTSGITDKDLAKLEDFLKRVGSEKIHNICIDVANGYTERFVSFISFIRKKLPQAVIMAGNVVTGEMTEQLILSGADIVKVGIGPGSTCITRKVTGVGYPQLSAVIECADAAHGVGGWICADGGCQVPGDIVKAFGGGADFVMLGGLLAGHDESEATFKEIEGRKVVSFYGSASTEAMEKHNGGTADYRTSEGKTVEVEYKGPAEETVKHILGGLRSACTYVGAKRLKELPKRTTFIRVTQQLNPMFD